VLKIVSKYLDSNKGDVQENLLRLIGEVADVLIDSRSVIEAALQRCEELLTLCDMLTDCKQVRQKTDMLAEQIDWRAASRTLSPHYR
jgi:predicted transcriptional regulator